ncbi:MAG: hypothetical protein UV73_C0008G0049 [Candidatus Gottesmanbacteria bacterium GW2011_GWA2_43_14]|uniref:Uncharacterized protein n=1 Tax=Candidatus Gottesmanbacteria bacterium GW2011_GWA2_43_14 TaxID=1618443 RepID=A0A0G1DIK6_9BACT|nr:MAG: hypothetical protein UV73_C0008G0049 [Candidatus Gottesmanbacteria bacterium GW2011_GWA2_43_14]
MPKAKKAKQTILADSILAQYLIIFLAALIVLAVVVYVAN